VCYMVSFLLFFAIYLLYQNYYYRVLCLPSILSIIVYHMFSFWLFSFVINYLYNFYWKRVLWLPLSLHILVYHIPYGIFLAFSYIIYFLFIYSKNSILWMPSIFSISVYHIVSFWLALLLYIFIQIYPNKGLMVGPKFKLTSLPYS